MLVETTACQIWHIFCDSVVLFSVLLFMALPKFFVVLYLITKLWSSAVECLLLERNCLPKSMLSKAILCLAVGIVKSDVSCFCVHVPKCLGRLLGYLQDEWDPLNVAWKAGTVVVCLGVICRRCVQAIRGVFVELL